MKSFFDSLGKLGEILAPVTGTSHTYFLAIQHHNNVEVQSLMMNSDIDLARVNENGYSSIHCASRFNNMFAIDIIMSRGNLCLTYFDLLSYLINNLIG
jgi:ankyrin repeat protein